MKKQQNEQGSGFLITCDKYKQKQAIKDAYNFINQYIEQIYGDIEQAMIQKELNNQKKEHNLQNQMQIRTKLKNKLKLLSNVQTNVNCLIFVKINQGISEVRIDPYKIVDAMMKDLHNNDRQLTRYCHKILPVEKSFKAEHFKMLDEVDSMFQNRDNSEIKSWALNFKCRNNSKFNYKQVLAKTEEIAKKYGHFVDIYYPQWTVCIEIVNHLMCLAIVEGYKQYQQFRLHKKDKKVQRRQGQKQIKKQQKKKDKQQRTDNKERQVVKDKLIIQQKQIGKNNMQRSSKQQHNHNEGKKDEKHDEHLQKEKEEGHKSILLQQKIIRQNDDDIDFI